MGGSRRASTSPLPGQLDAVQDRLGERPCIDAAVDTFVTRSNDLKTETRWPLFVRQAVNSGIPSMLSFRLYTHRARAGALNIYAAEPDTFDDEAVLIGEVLAAHTAIAITASQRDTQLRSALASRDMIGQGNVDGTLRDRVRASLRDADDPVAKLQHPDRGTRRRHRRTRTPPALNPTAAADRRTGTVAAPGKVLATSAEVRELAGRLRPATTHGRWARQDTDRGGARRHCGAPPTIETVVVNGS